MSEMMDFIAIDFETANEKRNSACAIGITRVRDNAIVDSFSRLFRPLEMRFASWNTKVHGLTENDVQDCPTLNELWPDILPIIENQLVVAHNASFDISVLRHTLHAASIPIPRITYLCTVQLARNVWPRLASHTLDFLADSFAIALEHHDAGSDSQATAQLVLRALQKSGSKTMLELANCLGLSFGELYTADEWIPTSAPTWRRDREKIEFELPADFDITSHEFYGKKIAITGTLKGFANKDDAFEVIGRFGGQRSTTVSKKTAYLVTGNQDIRMLAKGATESTKLQDAKRLREAGCDVRIISETDFMEMIFAPGKNGNG